MSNTLKDTVLKNDFCIGCGVCNYVDSSISIEMDDFGMLKAKPTSDTHEKENVLMKVCPFSNQARNEDEIAEDIFSGLIEKNEYIGKYLENYVGFVEEGDYRIKGSSGGSGKWIINQLLDKGMVDYAVQIVSSMNPDDQSLFSYQIFKRGDDVLSGSKSAYYPITMTDSLDFIRNNEGNYVVTAIPCFSKALRNLAKEDLIINERLKYIIGVVCGHLKSTAFAELLAWQVGVAPHELKEIEFRGKLEGKKANDKGVFAKDLKGNTSEIKSSKELYGGNWGYGFFKYKACDYCDDVLAETADVSIGDAWLPEYMNDHLGNNIVVVRNPEIHSVIQDGMSSGRLSFEIVKPGAIVKSQLGGIRHRREGLAYRLFLRRKEWLPSKRVKASSKGLNARRKWVYKVREEVRDASHKFFKMSKEQNDLNLFISSLDPLIHKLNTPPFFVKIVARLNKIFKF
ncbi:Coenzyme F420 hydrogenase/dehydrogenase, beta subunit C-terminal domain [Mongoliitalea lutea]|uniref:Coenzyme F420 hydrogenase n=1 Tax=Mongoliitalea lutea TaxID=849756 RepID=A0A8J3CV67_9BACT|nr:Coenzyme F420 hydrogenase/dehydrogenase, beta subunit C-terminal domain [Mongoliitalea lutea]GHB31525.1 coenzyme F420 hydrogenase [Mongoliitalea lutea]